MNNLYKFLRFTALMAMMMISVMTKAQISGLYYIANNNKNAYVLNSNTNWYLVPASDGGETGIDANRWAWQSNTTTPLVTTYQTCKDANSVWAVVKSGDYYYLIHLLSGQYMTHNESDGGNSNRRRFHMETNNSPGDLSLFSFINHSPDDYYSIQPKTVTSGDCYLNPSKNNQLKYYGYNTKENNVWVGGLIGLYSSDASADEGSKWFLEGGAILSAPTISDVSATNTVTITDANSLPAGYTIRYTTGDGSQDAPTATDGTEYSTPIEVTSSMTIKAVVVRYGMVLTAMATKTVVPVIAAPTVTNHYDGTISLSTTAPNANMYYSLDGSEPDNNSTPYTGSFLLGDATVIKAITYNSDLSESSAVTTYNVPKYTTPTITFDNSTSQVTITSEGTVYYNTGNGSQADPTPSPETLYNEPFTVNPPITVKVIATHPGYLNSDVATKYIQGDDYSEDYLTFKILTPGTIKWKALGSGATKTIEYKLNTGIWTEITSTSDGVDITVVAGDEVRFRGTNTSYCANHKSNYSGFEGGTATFNIEGNIMSLTAGDSFANATTLPSDWVFCSLFKKSLVVSAENLILPATTLKNYCYRALFSWCETLEKAPALPATTLATGCYWYMFEQCAITTAPELNATTLVQECYGHMFEGCSNLNYIKCMATSGFDKSNCLLNWVQGVSSLGTFVNEPILAWTLGASGIPSGWTYNAYLFSPEISCDGDYITITCATEEASIYYRLNQTGDFSLYGSPIPVNTTTTVEAYSSKGEIISNTVIYTFEIFDNPFDESTRSIDSWTYDNTQVTLPYSVNGTDGHSSSYAKGNHTFETTITLYKEQPTYLWFQHADQSADIYVDNAYDTTHWGGYNAFFVDISDKVHIGTNKIKVILNNTTRNTLAPCAGDFNFNATLGKVKLLTSPVMPSMDYGYDGFHITATDVSSSAATLTIKTKVPLGATLICKIDDEDSNYHYSSQESSTGEDQTFTTTIENPTLWNGTINPHLYTVTLEIYKDGDLYHRFQRDYGIRYYDYVINETGYLPNNEAYTGFLLNGSPYLLRGVCMHDDIDGKANALNDDDYAQEFDIIQELGCNFLRLAHYPHPKEVYDWCDRLGIVVQTEAPWVNRSSITETEAYWTHLEGQCADMVKQHYNHPCIIFWGVGNEINTTYNNTPEGKDFVKSKIEGYRNTIRSLMPNALVGYTVSHGTQDGLGVFNNPTVDWIGQNIYVGWYVDNTSNDPTTRLTNAINNATAQNTPCAFSEYGCGGTQHCHSDAFRTTTTTGNNPRHDIEYQMWLHEGHIAVIKNKPELLFTSQWQLFDIAVSKRTEGYKVCLDGETEFENNELKYLNNKGLVERDHKTKKDPFYLYKAWWNPTDKFVHICGKDYKKLTDRVIKCYTNDTTKVCTILKLYVNDEFIENATVTDNIATFTARDFNPGDVIRVNGATANDTFTFTGYNSNNVFTTSGNWNVAANWRGNAVPTDGSDVVIMANATVPSGYTANADNIDLFYGTLTISDGGQLIHSNEGVVATVQKTITPYTVIQNQGESFTDGWYFIASPLTDGYTPAGSMVANTYDLYRLNPTTTRWENFKNTTDHPDFTTLHNGVGYLYANSTQTTLSFTGTLKPYAASESVDVSTGWNLIGNPFAYNVYANRSFYKMNEAKTGVEAVSAFSTSPIAPCSGIVVDGNVIFSKEVPAQSQGSKGSLQIALNQANTRNNALLDNAIVSFNEDRELGKFYFGTQNANIYIPQDAEEYAIVNAEAQGEIPVNFKAKENGTYTLTINPEGVEMAYLHLIDNLTGTDIDLLRTPNYTFNANVTNYESRFKLVFASVNGDADGNDDNFAFFSNGNIIVNGTGTLQVVDILGHQLSSQEIHSSFSIPHSTFHTAGVYMLRLINGNDVKTQKIVIK